MYEEFCEDFKRFVGQPVCIYTTDGRGYRGTVLRGYNESVRILDDKCNLVLIPYRHIDAIDEPRMFNYCHASNCCNSCNGNGNGNYNGNGGSYDYEEKCRECCD